MKLLAKILKIEQQLCLAHGNHLSVVDIICNKKAVTDESNKNQIQEPVNDDEEESDENDEDNEDDEDDDDFDEK